jgi:hypothetical protein
MISTRVPARLLAVFFAALVALAVLVPTASAKEPNPGYTQFKGCPSPEEVPNVALCERVHVKGGHFQMGSKDVPIKNPIDLIGGLDANGNFVGGAFAPVKQTVPGGVVGLTGLTWLLEFFGVNALSLYATTELAGVPGNAFEEPVFLPIKVHLTTPSGVLGNNCYVGSTSNPINLNLIVGTTSPPPPNEPITGVEPVVHEENEILIFENGEFVDNSFAAPGASGCVLTLFGFIPISINGLVNSQSGLPSPAGTNETRQNFDLEISNINAVY